VSRPGDSKDIYKELDGDAASGGDPGGDCPSPHRPLTTVLIAMPPTDAGATAALPSPTEYEPSSDYRPGGYHPVEVGDVYNKGQYKVTAKLGWGVYSTVWLCDEYRPGRGSSKLGSLQRTVALKIQKSAVEYRRAAARELAVLSACQRMAESSGSAEATGASRIVQLIGSFNLCGPHGDHTAMVFESLGCSLLSVLQRFGALTPKHTRRVTHQVLDAAAFLHDTARIVHTDIKPENVLVHPKDAAEAATWAAFAKTADAVPSIPIFDVKLVDLGSAFFVDKQVANDIQTREYRCPEAILGVWPFTPAADVWSIGCLVFELLTGELLFDPPSPLPEEAGDDDHVYDQSALRARSGSKDISHVAQIVELLGPLPDRVVRAGRRSDQLLTPSGGPRMPGGPTDGQHSLLERVLLENFVLPSGADPAGACALMRRLLALDPSERISAADALDDPWLALEY
jgi:serine/threonine-protein kinase SRPK3